MTAWMIMMIAAAGPIIALADSFGDPDDEAADDAAETPEFEQGPDGDLVIPEDEDTPEDGSGETDQEDTETDGDQDDENSSEGNDQTFTDTDDVFEGTDTERQFLNLEGGDDQANGGRLSDILQGGDGADTLTGGGGGDYLYATDANSASASDNDADFLDGGAGEDSIYFSNDDTATGGSGGDMFVLRQDLTGNAIITDFDADADTIVFETDDPEALSVESQTITDDGVILTLSNGATLTLEGAQDTIGDGQITFEEVIGIA